jgi:hypothetical protein
MGEYVSEYVSGDDALALEDNGGDVFDMESEEEYSYSDF